MLSCKKCGAEMSGIDLVCKQCGTPWGKSGKSKAPLFFSFILVGLFSFGILYFTNPEILGINKDNITNDTHKTDNKTSEIPEENIKVPDTPSTPEVTPPVDEKPLELPKPVFTSSKASSVAPAYKTYSYTPAKTTDNDNTTAWLEGVKGNGENEWIEFSAETEQYVNGIVIYNGYQKNEKTYINNGKLKKVRLTFSDGTTLDHELKVQNFKESYNGVNIKFDETKKTKSIRITILSVYKGAYYEDTGINEIKFY